MTFVFDIPAFRVSFPAFADETAFPDSMLNAYWDTATCYISTDDYGVLHGECRYKAITLMVAHLLAISVLVKEGQTPAMMQSAGIDKINISVTPPPLPNQWHWWMNLTPYGQQLLALLQVKSVGGFYIGGLPERAGFRKIGGLF
jgi:hypothetical protein